MAPQRRAGARRHGPSDALLWRQIAIACGAAIVALGLMLLAFGAVPHTPRSAAAGSLAASARIGMPAAPAPHGFSMPPVP